MHTDTHDVADGTDQTHSPFYKCTKCGYSLNGIDLNGSCPECGESVIRSCLSCSYDLSGTQADGSCPECGLGVWASIAQGAIAHVDVGVLKRVHSGMRTVKNFILIYILAAILMGVVAGAASASAVGGTGPDSYYIGLLLSVVLNLVVLIIVYGWWKLSSPLIGIPDVLDPQKARAFLRVMALISAAMSVLTMIGAALQTGFDPNGPMTFADLYQTVVAMVSFGVSLLFFIAQMLYLRPVAKLLRNRKMERRAAHMVWSVPVVLGGFFLLTIVLVVMSPMFATVGLLIFVLMLVALVLYWNLIHYLAKDLKKVIQQREVAG